jgi:predicted GIY-YIG superfamily endonuclease
MTAWFYILRLQSGSLCIGATKNLEKRYAAHSAGFAGRTTALDLPVSLVYSEEHDSFYIKVLAFQRRFEDINAYAASRADFLISASFRKATFLINSFKISRGYKGSGSPTITLTSDGMPLILSSHLLVIFRDYILQQNFYGFVNEMKSF